MDWEPYDPSWLVSWLRAVHPDELSLIAALDHCRSAVPEDSQRTYVRSVDPAGASEPGAASHYKMAGLAAASSLMKLAVVCA